MEASLPVGCYAWIEAVRPPAVCEEDYGHCLQCQSPKTMCSTVVVRHMDKSEAQRTDLLLIEVIGPGYSLGTDPQEKANAAACLRD